MKKFLIIALLFFAAIEISAQTAFKYKREITALSFGVGTSRTQSGPLMDLQYLGS